MSVLEPVKVKLGFEKFEDKHTCEGEDISPQIEIEGLKAPFLAIILDDLDAPRGTFVHWVAWNLDPVGVIPEDVPKKARTSRPIGAVQGTNGFGRIGYRGPCPPPGKPHRYFFKVYGLDGKLEISPGSDKNDLIRALEGHVLQYGEAMAVYGR